ncbi:hypothetical protein BDV40DRAFT_297522 [Aspergillus tamarii]|uniref:Uncharacterized protein n=1 Tax=Aspergillus tamarii TaxID=41984 RepID=A0A5N6V3R1_ASPTM|nr:hypothetical protein BDV40DRAFT_297522 [Aspergillus tamarii]
MDTPGWQRFFAADPPGVEGWAHEKHRPHYLQVHNVMTQVNMFPRLGKVGENNRSGEYQVRYRCASKRQIPCTHPGVYTFARRSNRGLDMFFCDGFFRHKYLNDITNDRKMPVKSLPGLVSYEHLLAHEWTHVDLLGSSFHVMDLEAQNPNLGIKSRKVEGAGWSNILAWYGQSLPNVGVKYNADNYAWFWTNNWFNEKWEWKDNGLDLRWSPENTTEPGGPHDMAGPGLGFLMPKENQTTEQENCHAGNDPREVFCDYLGEPYSEWLKDREKPFISEGGCELT